MTCVTYNVDICLKLGPKVYKRHEPDTIRSRFQMKLDLWLLYFQIYWGLLEGSPGSLVHCHRKTLGYTSFETTEEDFGEFLQERSQLLP